LQESDTSESQASDSASTSSDNSDSCVSEDLNGTIEDVDIGGVKQFTDSNGSKSKEELYKLLEHEEPIILNGKRKRSHVDYNALNEELFGDAASPDMKINGQASSDDDDDDDVWSPAKKKK
jgi:hypothetical protein